jgi:lipopolysaccharide transport system ATP-binding protein
MKEIVLEIKDLSKQYKLGERGTGTISHDLKRWWSLLRGKEDPYLLIGDTNDRTKTGESEYVWALKDVNLKVNKGDIVGIIGNNGAGKSTLLKILSKVTGPSTGELKVKGRIAALLEVGTGFHPELTGRENIFLNGAVLGMSKKEITDKFDEIVEFSGIAKYVDTPVKRYSSGMTVRLGFAIAAHLEPDILIVDEVLAVGDAEFQQKAIGKMQEVSQDGGRTVLFVSHNMGSIAQLCNKAVLMEQGTIKMVGEVSTVIDEYLTGIETNATTVFTNVDHMDCYIQQVKFINKIGQTTDILDITEDITIQITFVINEPKPLTGFAFSLARGASELFAEYSVQGDYPYNFHTQKGTHIINYKIPAMLFKEGKYILKLSSYDATTQYYYKQQPAFNIESNEIDTTNKSYRSDREGDLIPPGKWSITKSED